MGVLFRKFVWLGVVFSLAGSFSFAPAGARLDYPQTVVPSTGRTFHTEYQPKTLLIQLTPAGAAGARLQPTASGEVKTGLASLDRLLERFGASTLEESPLSPGEEKAAFPRILKLELGPSVDPWQAAAAFRDDPSVALAEPNFIYHSTFLPNDPAFSNQWSLHNLGENGLLDADIDAPEAWDLSLGDPGIVIAIVDTGVVWNHPDLSANLWTNAGEVANNKIDDDGNGYIDDLRGWDFVTSNNLYPGEDGYPEDNNPMDIQGHGTHVAGIAAAVGNNRSGISGVCPRCTFMALRSGYKGPNGQGMLDNYDVTRALYYAIANGARVINLSFGGSYPSDLMHAAIQSALDQGIVVVASAGNHSSDEPLFPAAFAEVIAVGATGESDQRAVWGSSLGSAYGFHLDLAAPGSSIYSTYLNGGYAYLSGTSMSSPLVAGAAGLVLSLRPWLGPSQVRTILSSTTDQKPFDQYIGSGRLNVFEALKMRTVPQADLDSPTTESVLTGPVQVIGTAAGAGFLKYQLEYGAGVYPTRWQTIYQSTLPVEGGLLATWDTNDASSGFYTLRLRVTDTSGATGVALRHIRVDHELASGWPLPVDSGELFSPLIIDLDRDGQNEIVMTGRESGTIYLWRADGESIAGWPLKIGDEIQSSPAAADMDGDGKLEIVVGSMNSAFGGDPNQLFVLRHDGTPLPGWPVSLDRQVLVTPAIADLNLDGSPEIVASTWADYSDEPGLAVFVWQANGSPLAGWPKRIALTALWNNPWTSGPVLGDLTGDARLEIVMGAAGGKVYAWDVLGASLPGWPRQVNPSISDLERGLPQVVLGDLDGDGTLEVAATSQRAEVRVWRASGALVPGWPVSIAGYSLGPPALGDLDGDGRLEIAAHSDNDSLYAWRVNGSLLPGWPVPVKPAEEDPPWDQPVIADVNGDGKMDVIWGTWEKSLVAVQSDGSSVPGWPKTMLGNGFHTPAIGDLDRDGFLEMLALSEFYVYLWNLDSPAGTGQVQWGTYQFNQARTGRYEQETLPAEPTFTPTPTATPTHTPTPTPPTPIPVLDPTIQFYLPVFR